MLYLSVYNFLFFDCWLAGIGIAIAVVFAVAVISLLLGLCCCWLARQVERHYIKYIVILHYYVYIQSTDIILNAIIHELYYMHIVHSSQAQEV